MLHCTHTLVILESIISHPSFK